MSKENAPRHLSAWVTRIGSQVTAADILGISESHFSRILSGESRPSAVLARRIWRESGVPLEVLRPDIWGGL